MKKKLTRIFGVGVTLALLSSLLIGALPALALSTPTVSLSPANDDISLADADYVIRFTIDEQLKGADGDTITITFPEDTEIGVAPTVAIAATDGWVDGAYVGAVFAGTTWAGDVDDLTITGTMSGADQVGEGAEIRIEITTGIRNPSSPDDYTLDVKTSQEDAETSDPYEIKAPTIGELEGIVYVYNPSGILMATATGDGAITAMVDTWGDDGFTIEVSEGTYDAENIGGAAIAAGTEIVASGNAEDTIIKDSTPNLNGADVVFDGFTLEDGLAVNAVGVTVSNCIFFSEAVLPGIDLNGDEAVIENCLFDQTIDDSEMDPAIDADTTDGAAVDVDITDCEFLVGTGNTGMELLGDTDVSGCSLVGSSGTGIVVDDGIVDIEGSTFDSLNQSLIVNGGTVTVDGNTFQDCTPVGADAGGALDVTGTDSVLFINNQVMDTAYTDEVHDDQWAIAVTGNADLVDIKFNIFMGNPLAIYLDGGLDLDATHNYWGDDGVTEITEDGAGDVLTNPTLNAMPSGGVFVLNDDGVDGKDECGVVVTSKNTTTNANMMGVAAYDSDPGMAAPPSYFIPFQYVDVYVTDNIVTDEILIKIYGDVDKDSVAMVWGTLGGGWIEASNQGVNEVSGYVYVIVTDNTVPTIEELNGTPFGLADDQRLDAPMQAAMTPENGEEDARIKPSFSWDEVDGATGYEFQIAEDVEIGDPFDILEDSASTTANGHVSRDNLKYSTTYWWRVRAVRGAEKSGWTTAFFTTVAEPEPEPEPEPPVIVEEVQPPEITVEIPPAQEVQVIPDYLLWVVIGVAAVLVIAVIVLIVRTRRVA